ncbi:MAG TPA: hypothetical protein PKE12_10390 [Kiritimatiellia bacterium]|nr:hypothetical protein [Kiritimatiellia bacterium]
MKNVSGRMLAVLAVMTAGIAVAEDIDLRVGGVLYAPNGAAATGRDEGGLRTVDWDGGAGLELQAVFWLGASPWGIAASIGSATFDIENYSVAQNFGGATLHEFLEGDADMTVIGASIVRKLLAGDDARTKLSGALEAGIRHVSIDSNIDGWTGIGDDSGPALTRDQSLDIGDSVVGFIGVNLDYAIAETVSIFLHGGFQFDLDKGEVKKRVVGAGADEAGETELEALYGKIGLSFSL